MNLEKALQVFHDEIEYLANKDYPQWMIEKKANAYNTICDYISSIELDNEEILFKSKQKEKKLKFKICKLEGILIALGLKIHYFNMIEFMPLSHIEYLANEAIKKGYYNSTTPESVQLGNFRRNKDRIDNNIDWMKENLHQVSKVKSKKLIEQLFNLG